MQRTTLVKMPIIRVLTPSLPPMYAWPTPIKRAVFGLCVALCIGAYVAMAAGIIGLMTLVLGLM